MFRCVSYSSVPRIRIHLQNALALWARQMRHSLSVVGIFRQGGFLYSLVALAYTITPSPTVYFPIHRQCVDKLALNRAYLATSAGHKLMALHPCMRNQVGTLPFQSRPVVFIANGVHEISPGKLGSIHYIGRHMGPDIPPVVSQIFDTGRGRLALDDKTLMCYIASESTILWYFPR